MNFGFILLIAIGSILAFEGAIWAIFPVQMRRAYEESLRVMDDKTLHVGGLVFVAIGAVLLGIAIKFGA